MVLPLLPSARIAPSWQNHITHVTHDTSTESNQATYSFLLLYTTEANERRAHHLSHPIGSVYEYRPVRFHNTLKCHRFQWLPCRSRCAKRKPQKSKAMKTRRPSINTKQDDRVTVIATHYFTKSCCFFTVGYSAGELKHWYDTSKYYEINTTPQLSNRQCYDVQAALLNLPCSQTSRLDRECDRGRGYNYLEQARHAT